MPEDAFNFAHLEKEEKSSKKYLQLYPQNYNVEQARGQGYTKFY